MPKTHPHSEATYRVLTDADGVFAVEVSIPDSHPTKVSPFASEADAETWIADHRRRVEAQTHLGRSWHRAKTRTQ